MSVLASIMTSVHQPPTPRPRYPSDLSDTAWSRIRGLVVPTHHKGGRPCSQARWREYVNVLLYITRTGCPWRALPHDFTAGWSAAHATPANVQDRAAFADLLTACDTKTVTKVWADKGYTDTAPAEAAAKAGIDLDIVCGPKPAGGLVVQPRRWVVERTNGWINHHRRLVRQYKTQTSSSRWWSRPVSRAFCLANSAGNAIG